MYDLIYELIDSKDLLEVNINLKKIAGRRSANATRPTGQRSPKRRTRRAAGRTSGRT